MRRGGGGKLFSQGAGPELEGVQYAINVMVKK